MRRLKILIFFILVLSFTFIIPVIGAWENNGVVICNVAQNQRNPQLCPDAAGGAIIVWEDYRSGSQYDIYTQRINATGYTLWNVNGTSICIADNNQLEPQLCSDGLGGAIIVWQDYRSGSHYDIYAQKINASGIPQWGDNGTAICTAANSQYYPQLCNDGTNNTIIVWQDYRSGSYYDIYAQKINTNGTPQWGDNGIAICTAANSQWYPQLCNDGTNNTIIIWQDYRSGSHYDIYAQKIDANGVPQWDDNGIAICTAVNSQWYPQLCNDGAAGAIITWTDGRSGTIYYDIYAQKVNSTGVPQWNPNGTAICTAGDQQSSPQICYDGFGGAIITWQDIRGGIITYQGNDIYVQKIDTNGTPRWTYDGLPICTRDYDQTKPQLCSDGAGGAILTWEDDITWGDYDIYAQKVNNMGVIKWESDGIAICSAGEDQKAPQICPNGAGGAIITWQDERNGNQDIFANHTPIPPTGNGNPPIPGFVLFYLILGLLLLTRIYHQHPERKR